MLSSRIVRSSLLNQKLLRKGFHQTSILQNDNLKIIYTETDEAPALAS